MTTKARNILGISLLFSLTILLWLGLSSGMSEKSVNSLPELRQKQQVASVVYPDSLHFAGEKVPLSDLEVYERIDREFLVNTFWQSNTMLWLKRSNREFQQMEPILKKFGVPDDFKYLALIESGLMHVVSPAGAAGYWQLMPETAREYGLEVREDVDERYHLQKSTEAACKYLLQAKEVFGSWTMAAASYNRGIGGLKRACEDQKETNYYQLRLNPESSRYLPRILAAKYITGTPEDFGFDFSVERDAYPQFKYRTLTVDTTVSSWPDWSIGQSVSYKELRYHNPWINNNQLLNKARKGYEIRLPVKD